MAVRTAQEPAPAPCGPDFSSIHRLAFGAQSRGEISLRSTVACHRREKRSPIRLLTTPSRHLSMMPVLLPEGEKGPGRGGDREIVGQAHVASGFPTAKIWIGFSASKRR
jgi:hypothetical protein